MISRLVRLSESTGIDITEGSDSIAIAVETVVKTVKSWTPQEIDKAVTDSVKKFKVKRTALEKALETKLKDMK